ncbi:hypothetical protein SOCEGT47_052740 [Sorangium cellulosum]|uniref:Secreted protein n=1 Tax=Sorangium cellulosum TaxID=56 RepID=A0A4P2Q5P3_SORCE|nr:hypothetical protein [Sorangium cellulosum]AUX24735.1 hypothetical protein SOCEGT47_052740 [Sorangium cellulosum]
MSRREWARRALLVPAMAALASGVLYAGACGGGHDGGSSGTSAGAELDDVIYEGGATDEALVALLAAEPKTDASQGTAFDAPEDGAALPGDTAPELSFHVGGAAIRTAPPAGPALRRAAGALPAARDGGAPVWAELGALLGPVRAARAHGTPINGRAYFLVFSTEAREGLLRVFTTKLSYTPDAAAWDKLRSAGAPITVHVTNAVFENNRIAPGGGPFAGEPVTFSIEP